MIRYTFILIALIFTVSCKENIKSNSTQTKTATKINSEINRPKTFLEEAEVDTILERNNPNSLDLSKHQIFIDTTRSSEFYERLKNWRQPKWDKQTIDSYLHEIKEDFRPVQIDLKGFPSHFITLRKLNDQFVLYDRCDGIDPRFEIQGTAFIFYGPLESNPEFISKMIALSDNSIQLELRRISAKPENQKSELKIEKVDESVYKLTYKNQILGRVEYLTTVKQIEKFDLVVNNCPKMKMMEFDGFDAQ